MIDLSPEARPKGTLIWGHATKAEHIFPLYQLADRLQTHDEQVTLMVSCSENIEAGPREKGIIAIKRPAETATAIEGFLSLWQPDFVLWTAGHLSSNLVDRLTRRGTPIGLVAAEPDLLLSGTWRWFKGYSRNKLNKLNFIYALDATSLRDLENLGLNSVDVAFGGPFLESAISLPYFEKERAEMAALLLGRQVWLAAHLNKLELSLVLEAHRLVLRYSHRALLIVVPGEHGALDDWKSDLEGSQFRSSYWSSGDMPSEATQVLFADVEGELGLWYRIAPISFMGNSMFFGMLGSDPNEPAAHGSAILHGPYVGQRKACYTRFADAAAAKQVEDAESLAAAVTGLIQPDQCASMAQTAWEVASRGAALTDQIADRILDHVDTVGSQG